MEFSELADDDALGSAGSRSTTPAGTTTVAIRAMELESPRLQKFPISMQTPQLGVKRWACWTRARRRRWVCKLPRKFSDWLVAGRAKEGLGCTGGDMAWDIWTKRFRILSFVAQAQKVAICDGL